MLAEEASILHKIDETKKFAKLAKIYSDKNPYILIRIDDILKTMPQNQ